MGLMEWREHSLTSAGWYWHEKDAVRKSQDAVRESQNAVRDSQNAVHSDPVYWSEHEPLQTQYQPLQRDYVEAAASKENPGTWNRKPGPSALNQPVGLESQHQ